MNDWVAVVYVTGKKNAAVLRRHLTTSRVVVIVDARLPLIYSRRIDIAYVAPNRARLLARNAASASAHFTSATWIDPRELTQGSERSVRVPEGSRRIWILTGIDMDLADGRAENAVTGFLGRIADALDAAPAALRKQQTLRVGLFHDDLRTRDFGFERVALAVNRFFQTEAHGTPT